MSSRLSTRLVPVVSSEGIVDGTIANVDVSPTAAIAGTKVTPDFGAQPMTTSGYVGVGAGLLATAGNVRMGKTFSVNGLNTAEDANITALTLTNGATLDVGTGGLTFTNINATNVQLMSNGGVVRMLVSGTKRIEVDGVGIGFFAVAPVARPAAITQTYATASATHAAFTSADLTGITTSTTGSALIEPGAAYAQAEHQQNYRRIQDQVVLLRADLANAKQVLNDVIDKLQLLGLLQ